MHKRCLESVKDITTDCTPWTCMRIGLKSFLLSKKRANWCEPRSILFTEVIQASIVIEAWLKRRRRYTGVGMGEYLKHKMTATIYRCPHIILFYWQRGPSSLNSKCFGCDDTSRDLISWTLVGYAWLLFLAWCLFHGRCISVTIYEDFDAPEAGI